MSVTIRPYRSGGWEIDIRVVTPDGARDLRFKFNDVAGDDSRLAAEQRAVLLKADWRCAMCTSKVGMAKCTWTLRACIQADDLTNWKFWVDGQHAAAAHPASVVFSARHRNPALAHWVSQERAKGHSYQMFLQVPTAVNTSTVSTSVLQRFQLSVDAARNVVSCATYYHAKKDTPRAALVQNFLTIGLFSSVFVTLNVGSQRCGEKTSCNDQEAEKSKSPQVQQDARRRSRQ